MGEGKRVNRKHALSRVRKRTVRISSGLATSVSVEDAFWEGLQAIARERQSSLSNLLASIHKQRHDNFSSAVRLFVLDHYRRLAEETAAAEGKR
jgi:predicted DNA-binding ribbon-helix-helix protein